MFDLRDLRLLSALARHRHFGRAAAECGISQPAFSMRIRNLEDRLGVAIVRRGNRFQGLTPEGEAVVRHARGILDGVRSLQEEIHAASGEVSGALTLAAIPTAAEAAALLASRLHERHPGIRVRIETLPSLAIQLRIDEGTVDAGITYDEGHSGDLLETQPLYTERYVLVAPPALAPRASGTATWVEAAARPLALLEPGMQNRRILDRTFEEAGAMPRVISETNALTTALVMARSGHAATVLPAILIELLGAPAGTVVLPLTDPVLKKPISLVTAARGPNLRTVAALKETAAAVFDQ